jgi:transposase
VLNADNAGYLAPVTLAEPGRDLGHLLDDRRDKIATRTRMINTLRWKLHELGPDLAPGSLTTLGGPLQLAARLQTLPVGPGACSGVLRDLLIGTCHQLHTLTRAIMDLQAAVTTQVTDLCPSLLAVPGVGAITAATILAELGDPARIRSSAALARLAGVAPIPLWSSDKPRYRLDRGGNRRLNAALHTIALTQARTNPRAQALIAKHQAAKGKRGAIRVLKRHLADVVYRALQADMTTLTSTNTAA